MDVREIEIKHLVKKFEEHKVLDDINLTVNKGDVYGVLGLSGAGKSTLVRCINGLETFQEGEIYYKGELLCSSTKKIDIEKRKEIAMIFQSFNLLQQKSVYKNVLIGAELSSYSKEQRKEETLKALERVHLLDKIDSYPSQLSGGQQQRVAIARALVMHPQVLLCDEATSALDPDNTNSILSLLKELNQELNLTIIMISHQMEAIEKICNKVAIIDKAKIKESGSLNEIFLNPQSEITKKLIYSNHLHTNMEDKGLLRILFDGNVDEPIISELVANCHILVSIVFADTKVTDNKVYGQTVIKLPKDEADKEKIRSYLSLKGIKFEEVNNL